MLDHTLGVRNATTNMELMTFPDFCGVKSNVERNLRVRNPDRLEMACRQANISGF
jgi:hypothetical protein